MTAKMPPHTSRQKNVQRNMNQPPVGETGARPRREGFPPNRLTPRTASPKGPIGNHFGKARLPERVARFTRTGRDSRERPPLPAGERTFKPRSSSPFRYFAWE